MRSGRLILSGVIVGMIASARPSGAAAADSALEPTSQANVQISVSVAPRVQAANLISLQRGGLLCFTGTKLGATATLVRGAGGTAPKEVAVPIATGPRCDALDELVKRPEPGAGESGTTDLLLVAPQ